MGLRAVNNTLSIRDKYLEVLRLINDWVTVSEWAAKIGELNPELLENSGLTELAGRISSNISTGQFGSSVEVNEKERPRKVRYLSPEHAQIQVKAEIAEDVEPIKREEKKNEHSGKNTVRDTYRLEEFNNIIKDLNEHFGTGFELDHAKAILNDTDPGTHHPDNAQILNKIHSQAKSKANWPRFSLNEQTEYIKSNIQTQKFVAKQLKVEIDDDVLNLILNRLKSVF